MLFLNVSKSILVLAGLLFFLFQIPFFFAAGLSIDEISIQSNYFDFDKAWVVDFVSDDFTTDSISGSFTANDLKEKSGFSSIKNFTISSQTLPNMCEYDLREDTSLGTDVFEYYPHSFEDWSWKEEELLERAEVECSDFNPLGGDVVVKDKFPLKKTVYCVKENKKAATVGQFKNPFLRVETVWNFTSEDESEEKVITNTEIESGKSTQLNDFTWIRWQGFLGVGESCPLTENSIPLHSNSFPDGWRLGSQSHYAQYQSYISGGGLISDLGAWADGEISEESFKTSLLAKSNAVLLPDKTFADYSLQDTTLENGKLAVPLGKQIVYPHFQLIIDADYLGLVIPSGDPKIVSLNDVSFVEGNLGEVSLEIENRGSFEGAFDVRINCSDGFSSSPRSQGTGTLDPGEKKEMSFNILGSSNEWSEKLTGVCTVEAKDSTSQLSDTKKFNVEMSQIQECTPGVTSCGVENGVHVIRTCNSQGTGFYTSQSCSSEEICSFVSEEAVCIDPSLDEKGGSFFDFLDGVFSFMGNVKLLLFFLICMVVLFGIFVVKRRRAF